MNAIEFELLLACLRSPDVAEDVKSRGFLNRDATVTTMAFPAQARGLFGPTLREKKMKLAELIDQYASGAIHSFAMTVNVGTEKAPHNEVRCVYDCQGKPMSDVCKDPLTSQHLRQCVGNLRGECARISGNSP